MVTTPLIAIILGKAYFGHQELSLTVNALGSSMLITPLIAIIVGKRLLLPPRAIVCQFKL